MYKLHQPSGQQVEHELVKAEKGYLKEMQQAGLNKNCCSRTASDRKALTDPRRETSISLPMLC